MTHREAWAMDGGAKGMSPKACQRRKEKPGIGLLHIGCGRRGAMPSKKNQFNLELDSPLNSLKHEAK